MAGLTQQAVRRFPSFASLETRKGLEPQYVPKLFLESLLGTCQSAISQIDQAIVSSNSPGSLLRKLTSLSFLFLSTVANCPEVFFCFKVRAAKLLAIFLKLKLSERVIAYIESRK